MPQITICPDCEKKLRLPDHLIDTKVRCPACGNPFLARAEGEKDEEPAPVRFSPPRTEGYSERRSAGARKREEDEDEDSVEEERPRSRARDEDRRVMRREDRDRPRRREEEDEDRPRRRRHEEDDDYDEDYDDRPRRRGSNEAGGWRMTRLGILLVVIACCLRLLAIAVAILGFGMLLVVGATIFSTAASGGAVTGGFLGLTGGMLAFAGVLGLLMVTSTVLQYVGQGLCLAVPDRRGAGLRGLAIAAFACGVAAFLLNTGGYFVGGRASVGTGGTGGLLGLASFICWILFLRLVAIEMRGPDVAGRLMSYLIATFVWGAVIVLCFFIAICGGVMAAAGTRRGGGAGGVAAYGILMLGLGGVLALAWLGLQVWYIFLMQQVRGLIDRHVSRL
jgi:hypothetical protein